MVQIIQSQPTQRQSALEQALGQAVSNFGSGYTQGQQTKRQQALADQQLAIQLNAQGIDASPQDLRDYASGTYKPKVITPAQEAQPAQYGKELQGPVMPGQDPLREVFSRAKEATPAVMGNANPLMNYTESKKAQMAAATTKQLQEQKLLQSKVDAIPLDNQAKIADLESKKFELENKKELSPYTKRKMMAELDTQILGQKKLMGDIANQPYQQQKLIADTQKAQREGNPGAGAKLSKMSGETQGKVGSIASGLKALQGIDQSINNGVSAKYLDANTPIVGALISDNSFTQNQRVLDEVIGRLQSGGAIGTEEVKTFRSLGPRPGDKAEVQRQKIQDQKSFLLNKLTAFGMNEGDLSQLGFDTGATQSRQTQNSVASHPQVNQAMEWAKANPNDPRAKEIMARVQ